MKTALPPRLVKLIDAAMRPAGGTMREVAKRQSVGQAIVEDLTAGYRAASDVLKFIDGFDSDWIRRFPVVPSATPDTDRQYQLRFWQTAPEYLRPR